MSLFPIFKVNKLTNKNKTDVIYVFFGSDQDLDLDVDTDLNELFKRDPNNKVFANVFNPAELDNLESNKDIQVEFIRQTIHIDDSIGVIKLKIFEAIRRSASMSEIYLFCLKNEKLNPITIYQNLTQNDRLPLTRVRLEQVLKNIYDEDGEPIDFGLPKKDKYTFDDILSLDLTKRDYLVAKILGQKFVFNNEYPFIADPFYVTEYDALLEHSRRELTSLNNSLLLETNPIFNTTIYLCIAPDVFKQNTDVSFEYTCKIYFPFLYQENINTIDKLYEKRDKLIEDTSNKLTPDVEKGFESIDMFYNVFQNKIPSNRFSEKRQNTGIKKIKIIIHPDFQIKIPIDVIFKLIHATQEFPLIKFNPETRQENIYRLYADKMTSDGRKIPNLNKAIIFKLVKGIGKGRSVSVYTNIIVNKIQYNIVCEFADNGSITVYPLNDFETPVSIEKNDIDIIIGLAVNPLIQQIKPFFEQSGLEIPLFDSIKSINVEIRELTYQTVYVINNPIKITDYIGCISSAFTIETDDLKRRGIEMRFKRVANFNKRDSQEAFIIEKIDQGLKFDEMVDELVQNYPDVDDEIASDLIAKIRSELEVTRGANRRRALMIKINPGFKTRILLDSIVSEITVTVEGINDIAYLDTIPVYIDTLVRISQDINSSDIPAIKISKICTGKELDDVEFGQITAVSEQSINENQLPDIQDESPVYSKQVNLEEQEEDMDMDILDLLGYESDPEKSIKGGQGSDSDDSGKSVSTPSLSSKADSIDSGKSVSTPSLSSKADSVSKKDSIDSGKSVSTPSLSSKEDSVSKKDSIDSGKSVSTPSLSSKEDSVSKKDSIDSGKSVSTPSLSSKEDSKSIDSGKSVSTPSLSSKADSEDPNANVFEEKPIAIPTSKQDESSEDADIPTPSTTTPSTSLKSSSEEEDEKEAPVIKPPIVEVNVNVNPLPPLQESSSSEEEEEEIVKEKSPTPVAKNPTPVEVIEIEEKEKSPTPVEEILEIKQKPKKEKKIEAVKKEMENTVRDITNMKLRYPNPFTSRLEKNAPQLFVREKNDKIDVYTRMCPFSLGDRRQPIILTKKERDEMIRDHPDPRDVNQESDFIEYSTDPNDSSKKFYYTCPRFWCMLTDKMVTEEDIIAGKCGPKVDKVEDAIIPKTADSIKNDGRYVYQFYDQKDSKEGRFPGFHKKKTPSGLCIPCCYNKWKTEEMKNRRDLCQGKFDESEAQSVSGEEKNFEEQLKRDVQNAENYVKGPEKYGPQLGNERWGFLPIAVQKFLHEVNEDCQVSKMNASLKPNHTCILRYGVEDNPRQSFIACIASAMFYGQKDPETGERLITKFIPNAKDDHYIPTIKEMINNIIIPAIDIDRFVRYQNGDLITSFANLDLEVDINKSEYTESILYKKAEKEGSVESKPLEFFTRVVQAYETFIAFLRDPKIYIDYTYLWDLICTPNPGLFETGINLIILEMPDDDVTNNIELVCPTNRYSTHIYDARKRSLILIKRDNYFEPIYGHRYNLDRGEVQITKTFSEYDRRLPKTLRAVFTKIIKPTLGERCKALPSNSQYTKKFEQPKLLDTLIKDLMNRGYTILNQVLNFQGKVIGLEIKSSKPKELQGFIPCYPSSLTILKNSKKYDKKTCEIGSKCDFDFVYMTDKIWKSYDETLAFLKEYYLIDDDDDDADDENQKQKQKQKQKQNQDKNQDDFYRVVNNGLIIGFLTNTNQFIRVYDPVPIQVSSVNDNIKNITNNDMLVADIETLTTTKVDTKRSDFIKRIQLETNFYNVFRNTIRILFNDYSNSDKRKDIQSECNKRYILYRQQLDKVIEMLHDLVGTSIIFSTSDEGFNYENINENDIHNCIKLSKDKCLTKDSDDGEETTGICQMTDDTCTLVLPKNNLITDNDNEAFYYSKMADELIRYNRIKSFIFKPQAYLSFGQIKYNLRDNEILILQDLLTQDFFENLIPADINKFAKYNTYDTANPIVSQAYKKEYDLNEAINPNHERDCFASGPFKITSEEWSHCFPSTYKEIAYSGKSKLCALYMMIDIIKNVKGIKELSVEEIKDVLIEEYKRLTEDYKNIQKINTIIDILREEGQFDANQLQDETMNFEQMILQEGFGAVNFDLWILLVKYEIPSILISSKVIPESNFKKKQFVCYYDNNKEKQEQNFVFIVAPAMYIRYKNHELKNPEYKIIVNDNVTIESDNNLQGEIPISLDVLQKGNCLQNVEKAIVDVYPIEDFINKYFIKHKTTIHPARKPEAVNLEFVEVSATPSPEEKLKPEDINKQEEPKIVKLKKSRKLKPAPSFIIEGDEEDQEQEQEKEKDKDVKPEPVNEDTGEYEEVEIPPKIPKPKTRKKNTKIKVNPPGKTKRNRPRPESIEFVEASSSPPLNK